MYCEIIETIVAAINLLRQCGEGNNEITNDLQNVNFKLESMFAKELSEEDSEKW